MIFLANLESLDAPQSPLRSPKKEHGEPIVNSGSLVFAVTIRRILSI